MGACNESTLMTEFDAFEIVDPFDEMTAAVGQADHAFEELYRRHRLTYADFRRHLEEHDADTAQTLADLWDEINNDVCELQKAGYLTLFELQRWRQSLTRWRETLSSAVAAFAQQLQPDCPEEHLPFYTEAA